MRNFTFCFPCRNFIKEANEVIKLVLEYSNYDILIVDDRSNEPNGKYTNDDRVRIMYNDKKKGLSALWNQLVLNSSTEHIIIAGHKLRPKVSDFDIINQKLDEGFACVATYRMGIFGFSKRLLGIIGFFDENFTDNNFEDTDFMNRLFVNDLSLYISEETEYTGRGTTWRLNTSVSENYKWYHDKWDEQPNAIVQKVKNDEYTFLPWSKSRLKVNNIKTYFANKVGVKNVS